MSPVRRTWWVKLRRADKHLEELQTKSDRYSETHWPYNVTTEIQANEHGQFLIVRGHLRPFEGDDDAAAIVGDIVGNARSSLDHIHTALSGRDDTYFPILKRNIWKPELEPRTGKDRNKKWRDGFTKNSRGLPDAAQEFVKALQPYKRYPQFPETDPLAILQRLSNADKHRTLHVIAGMIIRARTTITIPGYEPRTIPSDRQGIDGAVIATVPWPFDVDPEVHAGGGIEIALKEADGENGGYWELPRTLAQLLDYVKDSVVEPLDAMIS